MIKQRNLSALANRLFERDGGKRINERVLERDYCISWILAGIARNKIGEKLVFKGGTALKKCCFVDYRFSEDLDFTLMEGTSFEKILEMLVPVYEFIRKSCGLKVAFLKNDRHSHANNYTFYLSYDGILPKSCTKELKVDITIKECLTETPAIRTVLSYAEYDDVPGGAEIRV